MAAMLAVAPWHVARSAYVGVDAQYSFSQSDNVAREESVVAESGTINTLAAAGYYLAHDPFYLLDFRGAASADRYSAGPFESELRARVEALAQRTLVRDRLTWTIQDSLDTVPQDSLAPDTPDNQERVNRFSTGPDLTLRITGRQSLGAQYRFESDDFEISDLSNTRNVGEVYISHRISGPSRFLLRYRYSDVSYDTEFSASNYTGDSLTAALEGHLDSLSTYAIEAGTSRYMPDTGDELQEPVGSVQLHRQITPDNALSVFANVELQDSTRTAESATFAEGTLGSSGINAGVPDISYSKRADIEYEMRRGFAHLLLTAYARQEDFLSSDLDVEGSGGGLDFGYELTPTLTAYAGGEFSTSDYELLPRKDRDTRATAGVERRFQRRWYVDLSYTHDRRESTDPLETYSENTYEITISYLFTQLSTFNIGRMFSGFGRTEVGDRPGLPDERPATQAP
jgi:hypothetical protein